jgi:hypothetical protein
MLAGNTPASEVDGEGIRADFESQKYKWMLMPRELAIYPEVALQHRMNIRSKAPTLMLLKRQVS